MSDSHDPLRKLRQIMIDPRADPISAIVDDDARRAAVNYPRIACHAPTYGAAEHLDGHRWRIVIKPQEGAPQQVRDSLTAYFRKLAGETADRATRDAYQAACTLLEHEKRDEVTAADRRVRVFRTERFVRKGPDGPEPPRPSDPDTVPFGTAGPDGLIIDPAAATGWSDAGLKMQLLSSNYPTSMPAQVYADSRRAVRTHPGGMLLPVVFTEGQKVNGAWQATGGSWPSPHRARDGIAFGLRFHAEHWKDIGEPDPGEELCRAWLEAADRIEATGCNEIELPDRTVRVVRVEQLVRIGSDGPEPPRPSDPDPDQPIEAT